jgi:hypothetical protein
MPTAEDERAGTVEATDKLDCVIGRCRCEQRNPKSNVANNVKEAIAVVRPTGIASGVSCREKSPANDAARHNSSDLAGRRGYCQGKQAIARVTRTIVNYRVVGEEPADAMTYAD